MTKLRKYATNLFIVGFLGVSAIDALPSTSLAHTRLKDFLDPVLDAAGLWQGSWQLFAPTPKKINPYITARIRFSDRSLHEWRSPDWRELSPWEKFFLCRHMKFFENLRQDKNEEVWPHFSDYLLRTLPGSVHDKTSLRVTLERHWYLTPQPSGTWNWLSLEKPRHRSHRFFAKNYP